MVRTGARAIFFSSLAPFNIIFFLRRTIIFNILYAKFLWLYHTKPHSAIKETPLKMVYGASDMLPLEIDTPTWIFEHFNEEENETGLRVAYYLIVEAKEISVFISS